MLIVGEIHTGLLQHSTPLSPPACQELLALRHGDQVRRSQRPISYMSSPVLLTGVDCRLATASGSRARGIGTVTHQAALTAGRVVQGSALATVTPGHASNRLPWSHYLASPGRLETIGRADPDDLAQGFLATAAATSTLDLGAISGRTVDHVQASSTLDRSPPFRAARTWLRWVAVPDRQPGEPSQAVFTIEDPQLRTLRLNCPHDLTPDAVAGLCEDLALHDWLLTTLLELIERSQLGIGPDQQLVHRLRPAIEHLLHLWMPAARLADPALVSVWESLETRPGLSRQWQASVTRIRDQLALCTVALMSTGNVGSGDVRNGNVRSGP